MTEDISEEFERFQKTIPGLGGDPGKLIHAYGAEIQKFQDTASKTAQIVNGGGLGGLLNGDRLGMLTRVVDTLQTAQSHVAGTSVNTAAQQNKDKAQAAKQNADAQTKAFREQDQQDLAELKADHELTTGEMIAYWKYRLYIESSNKDRVREITVELGTLYQEQDKKIASVARHGAALMEEQGKKAEAFKNKIADLTEDGLQLGEVIGVGGSAYDRSASTTKVSEVQAKASGEQGELVAQNQKLQLERQYSLLVIQTSAARIAAATAEASADYKAGVERVRGLIDQRNIAKEAEGTANAKNDITKAGEAALKVADIQAQIDKGQLQNANALYAAQTKILEIKKQQILAQWSSIGRGTILQDVQDVMAQVPQQASAALINGMFGRLQHGQSRAGAVGQGLVHTVEGAGKDLATRVLTQGIEKLAASFLKSIGIAAIQASSQTANTTALTTLTAAVVANTAAQGAGAAGGVAGGVAAGAGAAAGAAGSAASSLATGLAGPLIAAAGGIIGGLISGVMSWAGDNRIVAAVNQTTAAVNSLRMTGLSSTGLSQNGTTASTTTPTAPPSVAAGIFGSFLSSLTAANAIPVNIQAINPAAFGSGILKMFGFADGTSSAPGGWSVVGENGPELLNLPHRSQVVPNSGYQSLARSSSNRAASGGGASSYSSMGDMHFHAHGINDPDQLTQMVMVRLPGRIKSSTTVGRPYNT